MRHYTCILELVLFVTVVRMPRSRASSPFRAMVSIISSALVAASAAIPPDESIEFNFFLNFGGRYIEIVMTINLWLILANVLEFNSLAVEENPPHHPRDAFSLKTPGVFNNPVPKVLAGIQADQRGEIKNQACYKNVL